MNRRLNCDVTTSFIIVHNGIDSGTAMSTRWAVRQFADNRCIFWVILTPFGLSRLR
jgi:hypothetical protein